MCGLNKIDLKLQINKYYKKMALLTKFLITTALIFNGLTHLNQLKNNKNEAWMSKLPDDKKIVLINLPGTHDSASFNNLMGINRYAQCQSLNITEQLKIGVRKFDLRVVLDVFTDSLISCHGPAYCYYKDEKKKIHFLLFEIILLEIKSFLEQNPTETVFFSIDSCFGNRYENIKAASEFFEELIPEEMRVKFQRDLTLADTRGKFIHDFYKSGIVDAEGKALYYYGLNGNGLSEIHKKYGDYEAYKVDGRQKVKELEELFEKCDQTSIEDAENDLNTYPTNYPLIYSISCTGQAKNLLPNPKKMSKIVNPFVLDYDMKKGYYYGWINMDFAEKNIVDKIINTNF